MKVYYGLYSLKIVCSYKDSGTEFYEERMYYERFDQKALFFAHLDNRTKGVYGRAWELTDTYFFFTDC